MDISIIVGPYPQNTDNDSTTICWETSEKTGFNKVCYGLTSDCENVVFEKNHLKKYFHKIKLNNLTHSTKYFYKIVSDGFVSDIYSFYTSFETNESIRFIVYGDNRGEWDNWQQASIVAKAIEKEHSHFVLSTGDLVKNGKDKTQWYNFFRISDFIHNSSLYPILGNHERYGSSYFEYFSLPHNGRWYSFDNGPVHFIGLDSNPRNRFKLSQLLWLIRDLKTNEKTYHYCLIEANSSRLICQAVKPNGHVIDSFNITK